MTHRATRGLFQQILSILWDSPGIDINASLAGDRITVTADLDEAARSNRRPSTEHAEVTGEDIMRAVQDLRDRGQQATLTSVSKHLDVRPRTRLAPIVKKLLREKVLKKSGVSLRVMDQPPADKPRMVKRKRIRKERPERLGSKSKDRKFPAPAAAPPINGYDARVALRKQRDRERNKKRREARRKQAEQVADEAPPEEARVNEGEPAVTN